MSPSINFEYVTNLWVACPILFEGIYDLDKVKEDTNSIVHAILNNEEFKIDTSTIREKLDNNIRKYICNSSNFC